MSSKRKLLKLGVILLIIVSLILGSKMVYDEYFVKEEKTGFIFKINLKPILESSKKTIDAIKDKMVEGKLDKIEEDSALAQQETEDSQDKPINEEKNNSKPYVAPKNDSNTISQNNKPQQAQSTPIIEQPAPSCTPKKFYTTFRADFTSEAECEAKYNYYHEIDPNKYLGFICSYQTDDCGDTYYMLTFFDSNGHYFGYNEI